MSDYTAAGINFDAIEESQRIQNLRMLVNHTAWLDFYLPALEAATQHAYALLKSEPDQRKTKETDALLRARISVLEAVIRLGPETIADYDDAQRQRDKAQAEAIEYDQRTLDGRMAPR